MHVEEGSWQEYARFIDLARKFYARKYKPDTILQENARKRVNLTHKSCMQENTNLTQVCKKTNKPDPRLCVSTTIVQHLDCFSNTAYSQL